ncbi:MAG: type IV toxin-antitoxin system AbiEi family antitoxin domain-containing protein [Spirochaetes bacterium]|nr:type IV toxin-antitoxin system AbiEi family antitoxin domain-containing protein [Spirochaetota bacterium]
MRKSRGKVTTRTALPDAVRRVMEQAGIARSRDLERLGTSRVQLRRLVERGALERVGRGLYRLPGAPVTERQHFAEAALRVPGGVICLLSALRFHGLTTQNPFEVWMAIDLKAWRPKGGHPPIRLCYLSGPALAKGMEEHDVSGVVVRVYGAAKTVADCFKFRNKIGIDVAVEALRSYRKTFRNGLEPLWKFAEMDRVARVIRPYLEAG